VRWRFSGRFQLSCRWAEAEETAPTNKREGPTIRRRANPCGSVGRQINGPLGNSPGGPFCSVPEE